MPRKLGSPVKPQCRAHRNDALFTWDGPCSGYSGYGWKEAQKISQGLEEIPIF